MIQLFEGKLAWNSPIVRAAFEKLDALYAQGFINDKQSAAITSSQAATEFLSGKAPIEMAGTWAVGDLSTGVTKAPFDWGLFHFPSWSPGLAPTLPVGVGQTFLINAHSKNKDAAAQFVDFAEQLAVLTKGRYSGAYPALPT